MRTWSLVNLQQKKIWIGLTEKEILVAITFMGNEQAHLLVHKQGDQQWSPIAVLKEIYQRNTDLFDPNLKPHFKGP